MQDAAWQGRIAIVLQMLLLFGLHGNTAGSSRSGPACLFCSPGLYARSAWRSYGAGTDWRSTGFMRDVRRAFSEYLARSHRLLDPRDFCSERSACMRSLRQRNRRWASCCLTIAVMLVDRRELADQSASGCDGLRALPAGLLWFQTRCTQVRAVRSDSREAHVNGCAAVCLIALTGAVDAADKRNMACSRFFWEWESAADWPGSLLRFCCY